MSVFGLLLLGALLSVGSADARPSAALHAKSRELLLSPLRQPVCTPATVAIKPAAVPKVCPPGTWTIRDAAGLPAKCVTCPRGYQFNKEKAVCVLRNCPGDLKPSDNDGPANGLTCCKCPNRDFPLFLDPASGDPACYPRCPSNTIQINFPVPKCCSTKCPMTANGVRTVPIATDPGFCRIPRTFPAVKVARDCRDRRSQTPDCQTFNATVEPIPVNLTCPWNTLEVAGADGNTTCWLCSSGAASVDVNGTVVCPPGLGRCPTGYRRCGGYCWNNQEADLRALLGSITPARCSKFLSFFAKCTEPCAVPAAPIK